MWIVSTGGAAGVDLLLVLSGKPFGDLGDAVDGMGAQVGISVAGDGREDDDDRDNEERSEDSHTIARSIMERIHSPKMLSGCTMTSHIHPAAKASRMA